MLETLSIIESEPSALRVCELLLIEMSPSDESYFPLESGLVGTLAGSGNSGSEDGSYVSFSYPRGVYGNSQGGIYVADSNSNKIRLVESSSGLLLCCFVVLLLELNNDNCTGTRV